MIALVATLAAMAALGRVAFAALPNVKPTTDIVLIAGYVLGGAPGFMVGAVAALASNLFFGQGPWTPWQMVAWGGVGLFGAGLARVFGQGPRASPVRRRLRDRRARLRRGHEPVHVGARSATTRRPSWSRSFGTSLPFDVAHATGNVIFCLAFGPALVRALRRYPHALRHHLAPA